MTTVTQLSRARARLMASAAVGVGLIGAVAQGQNYPGQSTQAAPTTIAGDVSYSFNPPGGNSTGDNIFINTTQAIINWDPDSNGPLPTGPVDFLPEGSRLTFSGFNSFTVLNRILPADGREVMINGRVVSQVFGTGAGSVWFYTPGGLIVGANARFDVGNLVLTTNDILTDGGLFGATGEIRFRGAEGSNARVDIAGGAQLNLNQQNSYLALVAPRVSMAGTATVNGSVAYVAAESVDVRVNNGLFDINFIAGTNAANALAHTGTTTSPEGDFGSKGMFLAAVPKNNAITMLLQGTIGYQPAASASVQNGRIILSAGQNIVEGSLGSVASGNGAANIEMGPASVTSELLAVAKNGISLDLREGDTFEASSDVLLVARDRAEIGVDDAILSVGGDLTLDTSGENGGTAALTAVNDAIVTVDGRLGLVAEGYGGSGPSIDDPVFGGTAAIDLTGSTLSAGEIFVSASADGGRAGPTKGGIARVTVTDTNVEQGLSTGTLTVLADAARSLSSSGVRGPVEGGTSSFTVARANSFVSDLFVSAKAVGGFTFDQAVGPTTGGSANVTLTDTSLDLSSLEIDSSASGTALLGTGGAAIGGAAKGGTALLELTDATLGVGQTVGVRANGSGGLSEAATGGFGEGGGATIRLTRSTADASFEANANGSGGSGVFADEDEDGVIDLAGAGGNAKGGTVELSLVDGSTISTMSESQTSLSANARGGFGATGGDAEGGAVTMAVDSSDFSVPFSLLLEATAQGGSTSSTPGSALYALAAAGDARGGTLRLALGTSGQGGTVSAGDITLDASARQAPTEGLALGSSTNATGGDIAVVARSGSLSVGGLLSLDASAFGGVAFFGEVARTYSVIDGDVARGGSATGGIAALSVGGASVAAATARVRATGYGGEGSPTQPIEEASGLGLASVGGAGTGGSAAIALTTGTLTSDIDIDASGRGGSGGTSHFAEGRAAGDGRGGTASFTAAPGTIWQGEAISVTASGLGGSGGQALASAPPCDAFCSDPGDPPVFVATPLSAGRGGNGVGGTTIVELGATATFARRIELNAAGIGGDGGSSDVELSVGLDLGRSGGAGGSGTGGAGRLVLSADNEDLDIVSASLRGIGGNGGRGQAGGAGGTGTGGEFDWSIGGLVAPNAVDVTLTAIGGEGGTSVLGAGANGGAATGGRFALTVGASGEWRPEFGSLTVFADSAAGSGGAGGSLVTSGGTGGTATGARVTLSALGGTIDIGSMESAFELGATGGSGGLGGTAATTGAGGVGGAGGNGAAGSLSFEASAGGSVTIGGDVGSAVLLGYGGSGGAGGEGANGAAGARGADGATNAPGRAGGIGSIGGAGGSGGAGGIGTGGSFALLARSGGVVSAPGLSIAASGFAGGGGDGGSGGAGGAGGDGGTGGAGIVQGDTGGAGGLGGDGGAGGLGGSGGTSGSGIGGTITLTSDGGTLSLAALELRANGVGTGPSAAGSGGQGGLAGQGGSGGPPAGATGAAGNNGGDGQGGSTGALVSNRGGSIALDAVGGGVLGATTTTLEAIDASESGISGLGGSLSLTVNGSASRLLFDSLDATTGAPEAGGAGAINLSVADGILDVGSDASLRTGGVVNIAAVGTGYIEALGSFEALAGNAITVGHLASSSSAPTLAAQQLSLLSGGAINARTARLGGAVSIAAGGGVELGSGTVESLSAVAGLNPFDSDSTFRNADLTLGGALTSGGEVTLRAGGSVVLTGSGAITADGAVSLTSGNDIVTEAGSSILSGETPEAMLSLTAGGIATDGLPEGNIAAARLAGVISANGQSLELRAQAIEATGAELSGGNVRVDMTSASIGTPQDDDGLLSLPCVEGNICLGSVSANGQLDIGTNGFARSITLGNVSAGDLTVNAADSLTVGDNTVVLASGDAALTAGTGDLIFGNARIEAGGPLLLTAGRDLAGANAEVVSAGLATFAIGRSLSLGSLTASAGVRTAVEQSFEAGLVLDGSLQIAGPLRVGGSDALTFAGRDGVSIGSVLTGAGVPLTLRSEFGDVSVGAIGDEAAAVADITLLASGAARLDSLDAGGNLIVNAGSFEVGRGGARIGGDASVETLGTALLGSQTLGGTLTANAGGAIEFGDVGASGSVALTGATITGTSIGGSAVSLTAPNGIAVGSILTNGLATLTSTGAPVLVGELAPGATVAATGRSLVLRGSGALTVTSATATAGPAEITASGNLTVNAASASGRLTLASSGGNVTGGTWSAGEAATIGAASAVSASSLTAAGASGVTAGGAITLGRLANAGTTSLNAGGALNVADVATAAPLDATGQSVRLAGAEIVATSLTSTAGAVDVRATGRLRGGRISARGGEAVLQGSGVEFGTLDGTSTTSISAGGGGIAGSAILSDGAVTLNSGGSLALAVLGTPGTATLRAAGDLQVSSFAAGTADVEAGTVLLRSSDPLRFARLRSTAGFLTVEALGGLSAPSVEAAGNLQLVTRGLLTATTVSGANVSLSGATGLRVSRVEANGTAGLTASNGTIVVTDGLVATAASASGLAVSLRGDSLALSSVTATAGNVDIATSGTLQVTRAEASNAIRLSGAAVTVERAAAGRGLALIAGAGGLGAGMVTAGGDINATSGGALTFASIATPGLTTLNAEGALRVNALAAAGGSARGQSVALASTGPLSLARVQGGSGTIELSSARALSVAELVGGSGVSATGSSVALRGPDMLTVTRLQATAGDAEVRSGGTLTVGSAGATGLLTLASNDALTVADVTGGNLSASGRSLSIGGGDIVASSLTATAGNIDARARGTLTIANLEAAGATSLTAGGALRVDALRATNVTATGARITLTAPGALVLSSVRAGGAANLTAGGLATVNGLVLGSEVAIRSADIAIGTGGQVGEQGTTGSASFTGPATMTVGGSGAGTGYRLDNAELSRVFARDISIATGTSQTGSQRPAALDPNAVPQLTLDTLTLSVGPTGNLGSSGTLRVNSGGTMRVVGPVRLTGTTSATRLELSAPTAIQVRPEGSLVLGGASGPSGTIVLTSADVFAGSAAALADVAAATDPARIAERLSINDGPVSDTGYFSAGSIVANVGSGFYVQNSGENGQSRDYDLRRGLTVGSGGLTVRATGSGPVRFVVNGREAGGNGEFVTGLDFGQTFVLPDQPASGSSLNGCSNIASCRVSFTLPADTVKLSERQDGLNDTEEERERQQQDEEEAEEEAERGGNRRPQLITTLAPVPSTEEPPPIEEAVTGSGNEDFYAGDDGNPGDVAPVCTGAQCPR